MALPENSPFPEQIPASAIGLPTRGAVIDDAQQKRRRWGTYWRVDGRILPVDSAAEPISFRAQVPVDAWNGRILHVGGGGFNGTIPTVGRGGIGAEMWGGVPTPIEQGYLVVASDSGHRVPLGCAGDWSQPATVAFATNDEMLANFAHEHIKKVHDVALAMALAALGAAPVHSYYCGTSNGGREALRAAQLYPDDFDGIVVGYPAIYWIPMALAGARCASVERELGVEGWISADLWRQVEGAIISELDELDGVRDGLISNIPAARMHGSATKARVASLLTSKQMSLVERFMQPYDLRPIAYPYADSFPGYAVLEGEPLRDDDNTFVLNAISRTPGACDGQQELFAQRVISGMVMRDPSFESADFDVVAHRDAVLRASALLDAGSTDLDSFRRRGGKAILYHGTYDQLIPPAATEQWFAALQQRYGREETNSFARFSLVPGMGHGLGRVDVRRNLLGELDAWVSNQ